MKLRGMALVCVLALAGGACGGGDDDGAPVADAGGGDPADAAQAEPEKRGSVVLDRGVDTMSLDGYFFLYTPGDAVETRETSGACELRIVTLGSRDPVNEPLDGGELTATGPDGTFTATAAGSDKAYRATGAPLGAPGDTLTLALAGSADVAAFADVAVVVGETITVIDPPRTDDVFARADDLVVTWTGGAAGTVDLVLNQPTGDGNRLVLCRFAADAGTGALPASLLGQLAAGQVGLAVTSGNEVDVDHGDTATEILVRSPVQDDAAETYFGGLITLE